MPFGVPRRFGGMPHEGKLLPTHSAAYLGAYIRRNALENDVRWVDGCFFMHVVRGTARTIHHTNNHHAAKEALSTRLHNAHLPDVTLGEMGEWWVDVGMEIASMKDLCLQWSTSSHSYMVEEVLGINKADADCITELESPTYARDLASHLSGVSGWNPCWTLEAAIESDISECLPLIKHWPVRLRPSQWRMPWALSNPQNAFPDCTIYLWMPRKETHPERMSRFAFPFGTHFVFSNLSVQLLFKGA